MVLMEVVEHLDPDRLPALERTVFDAARPEAVVVTTPNAEHNVRYEALAAGAMRHPDHRFEWTRAEFAAWAAGVAREHGYAVQFRPSATTTPRSGRRPSWRLLKEHGAPDCAWTGALLGGWPHEHADDPGAEPRGARRRLRLRQVDLRAHGTSGGSRCVSSDFCRGLVTDDENDQGATKDAFDVLGFIVGKRLAAGRLTVVDATNVQPDARRQLVELATRARRAAGRDRARRARSACAVERNAAAPRPRLRRARRQASARTSCAGRCAAWPARASARSTC